MIVAHPDDESLFGGAKLILEKGWKVICITNGNNPVRRKEFEKAMEMVRAEFEIWSYPDNPHAEFDSRKLLRDLARVVGEKDWDKIISHNETGEYGHSGHRQMHRLMRKLDPKNLSFFEFGGELSGELWEKKSKLISEYKSQKAVCDRLDWLSKFEKF